MPLTCWIVYNGYLQSDVFIDYATMLQQAAHELGHEAIILSNNEIANLIMNEQRSTTTKTADIPDYVLFTDKDIYLAKQLEQRGIRVFNRANTIAVSDDKINTYIELARHHLPIPKTLIAPKTFGMSIHEGDPFFQLIKRTFTYPFIVKEAFGSFGEQVYLIDNEVYFYTIVERIAGRPFLVQSFIETSYGRDIRLQVVGGQVVAAMKRTAEKDFRANVSSGGAMHMYEPNQTEIDVALRAAKALQADFAGVDLLFGEGEEPIICEVNSNAHIRNLLDCTGKNVAYDIVRHVETIMKEEIK